DSHELTSIVAETPVGKDVGVKYIHDGKLQDAKVVIVERTIDKKSGKSDDDNDDSLPEQNEKSGKLGFSASTLTEEQATGLRIKSGVVIDRVVPESEASDVGLRRGDVIHQINRQPIRSIPDLNAALQSIKAGDNVVMQVERNGVLSIITLT